MVDLAEIQAAYYMVAATGVLVAAAYYVMNIKTNQKNQELMLKSQALTNEIRQADLIQKYTGFIVSKEMMSAWTELVIYQNFSTFDEWMEKYGRKDKDAYNRLLIVMGFLNGYGVLYEKGLMDIETIEKTIQPVTFIWVWYKVESIVRVWRAVYKDPDFYSPLEVISKAVIDRNPTVPHEPRIDIRIART
jgi:hypothetical protein